MGAFSKVISIVSIAATFLIAVCKVAEVGVDSVTKIKNLNAKETELA